jgi:hypothetical protein
MAESMGGFNVTQIVMNYPDLFSRVALQCPALTVHSPYASSKEIDAFIKRTGASPVNAYEYVAAMRGIYPDVATWAAEDPLESSVFGTATPPFYISWDAHDEFGFEEADQRLADHLQELGVPTEQHALPGKHCDPDAIAVAGFLSSGRSHE